MRRGRPLGWNAPTAAPSEGGGTAGDGDGGMVVKSTLSPSEGKGGIGDGGTDRVLVGGGSRAPSGELESANGTGEETGGVKDGEAGGGVAPSESGGGRRWVVGGDAEGMGSRGGGDVGQARTWYGLSEAIEHGGGGISMMERVDVQSKLLGGSRRWSPLSSGISSR